MEGNRCLSGCAAVQMNDFVLDESAEHCLGDSSDPSDPSPRALRTKIISVKMGGSQVVRHTATERLQ